MLSAGGMMGGFGSGGMMGGARGQYGMAHWQGMGDWMRGLRVHAFGMVCRGLGLVYSPEL